MMTNMNLGLAETRSIATKFSDSDDSHVVFTGDARGLLESLSDSSVQLIITSPPYNIGKSYEKTTNLSEYLANQLGIAEELVRVLADGGSLCWQVGNYVQEGEIVPLDIPFYSVFKNLGLKLRNRIVWTFGHGLHASKRFSGRYETILWFTKGDDYKFRLDNVRIPSKYPGKRHWKGANVGLPSGNPLGKNPSDIWRIVAQDWESEIWDVPNVKANHPEKTSHPCQYPVELVQRCILALTDPSDIVLDPFGGIGTTVLAADVTDRRGVMSELQSDYCNIAIQRIQRYRSGELKVRRIGTPIHAPTGREKVSQVPTEWSGESGK